MIQRIQTVFLFLVLPLNGGFYFTSMFNHVMADPSQWFNTGFIVAVGISTAISLFAIFLYENRPNQIRWVKRALIFQILALGSVIGVLVTLGALSGNFLAEVTGMSLLAAAALFQVLAVIFIQKDDKLVKSVDRLR